MRDHFKNHSHYHRGFTLMELMVVLVILSVITALALPNYNKSVANAKERRALNNLYLIYGAEKTYFARNSSVYWPPNGPLYTLAQINTSLGLNILADGDTYTCRFKPGPSTGYTCKALFHSDLYELKMTEASIDAANPCCSVGTCPITPAC